MEPLQAASLDDKDQHPVSLIFQLWERRVDVNKYWQKCTWLQVKKNMFVSTRLSRESGTKRGICSAIWRGAGLKLMKVMLTWIFSFLCAARPGHIHTRGGEKKASLLFFCFAGESYDFYFYHSVKQVLLEAEGKYTHRTDLCIVIVTSKPKKRVNLRKVLFGFLPISDTRIFSDSFLADCHLYTYPPATRIVHISPILYINALFSRCRCYRASPGDCGQTQATPDRYYYSISFRIDGDGKYGTIIEVMWWRIGN